MTGHDKHAATPPAWMRRRGRWLELHAIALTPDHFLLENGVRAAFIVAMPLLLIIATGQSQFGWAIFAAFCLADTGGPERTRRALLSSFVALDGANRRQLELSETPPRHASSTSQGSQA
jgi:hypothetical protein